MKSLLLTVAILFSLILVPQYAQAQQSCTVVDSEDVFNECCTGRNFGVNYAACSAYQPAPTTGGTTQNNQCSIVDDLNYQECCINSTGNAVACTAYAMGGPAAGTIGGGTPNTNPQNGGTTGGGTSTPGVILPPSPNPSTSSASLASCTSIKLTSLIDILIWIKCIIGAAIIPLIMSLAFVYFLWGMTQYIRNANDVKKREESKKFIYYGIIGLFVMVAVWGIVRILTTTFGLGNTVPQLQTDCLTTNTNNPCKK